MKINNRITIDLEGIGKATATAVKKENDMTWFVFDGTIGNSTMKDIDNFLSTLVTKFPQPLQDRLEEIRLLDASEVFSDCDMPEDWEDLQRWGVRMERPQIPYFKSVDHRIVDYIGGGCYGSDMWWLHSAVPTLNSTPYTLEFPIVTGNGHAIDWSAGINKGVRPLFILKDIED